MSEPAASPQSAATPEPTAAKLRQAVDELNRAVQPTNNNLQFSIDQSTQLVVVKVVDAETGDVIRQIPPKTALAIAEQIDQQLNGKKGLLLSQSA